MQIHFPAVICFMENGFDYEKDFVEKNLIAYIGNKRRLLPLITKAIGEIAKRGSEGLDTNEKFIDYFAGTGVVSRLAKSLGFEVWCNDWETYSYIINQTYIGESKDLLCLFESEGGIEQVLETLNALDKPIVENSYIAPYYCPQNDDFPDVDRERLFYTRENGILIDNIRQSIEYLYPKDTQENSRKKNCLISLLLYEASVRSNTNGVFKGFHRGFGGIKRDALGRIKRKLKLARPKLSKKTNKCSVTQMDAVILAKSLAKKKRAEIVYLDPPYNQHQYGSNYHLLNTIARNDKPDVNREFIIDGKKVDKSAIRKDWKQTKSSYCYKNTALEEFKKLVSLLNTKYILVSYSTEGIIDFDDMLEVLANKGKVGIVTTGYVRFRGGRQSNQTKNKNVEFILMVDTGAPCSLADLKNVKGVILKNNLLNIFDETFPLSKPGVVCRVSKGGEISVHLSKNNLTFELTPQLKLDINALDYFETLSYAEKRNIYRDLFELYSYTNAEEIHGVLDLLSRSDVTLDRKYLAERLVILFNKINPQKTPEIFEQVYYRLMEADHQYGLFRFHPQTQKKWGKIVSLKKPPARAATLSKAKPLANGKPLSKAKSLSKEAA